MGASCDLERRSSRFSSSPFQAEAKRYRNGTMTSVGRYLSSRTPETRLTENRHAAVYSTIGSYFDDTHLSGVSFPLGKSWYAEEPLMRGTIVVRQRSMCHSKIDLVYDSSPKVPIPGNCWEKHVVLYTSKKSLRLVLVTDEILRFIVRRCFRGRTYHEHEYESRADFTCQLRLFPILSKYTSTTNWANRIRSLRETITSENSCSTLEPDLASFRSRERMLALAKDG